VLEDHVRAGEKREGRVRVERAHGNYELASENMKKVLLDKGQAEYGLRSAVSALMLAKDKAAGGVLSAKKRRFNKAAPSGSVL